MGEKMIRYRPTIIPVALGLVLFTSGCTLDRYDYYRAVTDTGENTSIFARCAGPGDVAKRYTQPIEGKPLFIWAAFGVDPFHKGTTTTNRPIAIHLEIQVERAAQTSMFDYSNARNNIDWLFREADYTLSRNSVTIRYPDGSQRDFPLSTRADGPTHGTTYHTTKGFGITFDAYMDPYEGDWFVVDFPSVTTEGMTFAPPPIRYEPAHTTEPDSINC